jgi:hypothetical protein
MLATHYVWLAWACCFLLVWAIVMLTCPRPRAPVWWSSLVALPFALTEACFVGLYWNPPSLWDLAARFHFDIESVIFCFAIGGIAAGLFNVVTRRPIVIPVKRPKNLRWQQWHNAALASGPLLFAVLLVITNRPLIAGVIAMTIAAALRMVILPSLRFKVLFGSVLFASCYAGMLAVLRAIAPGYLAQVWSARALALGWIGWMPVTELAFAISFGLFWSGLYEQLVWTISGPVCSGKPLVRARASCSTTPEGVPRSESSDTHTHPPAPARRRR